MIPGVLIAKKRDGLRLSTDEIDALIGGFHDGEVTDYQMAALGMAVCIRGMDADECTDLTRAMLNSGRRLARSTTLSTPRVDKHSTGGLGDKTSLILAPLLACMGLHVPMISGRGLGITGGTLDKLEAIPGFRVHLPWDSMHRQIDELGCMIVGASPEIAPVDQRWYALRDVTGTVESIPLITASILSKKLAESLDALVLDVKFGSAAFMKTLPDARRLATSLVQVAARLGVTASALLTDMNQPLGQMVGNAVEVQESLEVLQGRGPADVRELVECLAAELLVATHRAATLDESRTLVRGCFERGDAYERFCRMVKAQGGRMSELAVARCVEICAPRAGWVEAVDGQRLGQLIIALGGGRRKKEDPIDPTVGVAILAKIGDRVDSQTPMARIYADESQMTWAREQLLAAISLTQEPLTRGRPVLLGERIAEGPGVE